MSPLLRHIYGVGSPFFRVLIFIPQGFAGGMADPYTGLTKFGYRYYDPKVGRFVTLDPARDYRGDCDLYDYCADDPVNRVDRDGLAWWLAVPMAARLAQVYGPRVVQAGKNLWRAGSTYARANPNGVSFGIDAVEGAVLDGPPPPTPGGYTGSIGSRAIKYAKENKNEIYEGFFKPKEDMLDPSGFYQRN